MAIPWELISKALAIKSTVDSLRKKKDNTSQFDTQDAWSSYEDERKKKQDMYNSFMNRR